MKFLHQIGDTTPRALAREQIKRIIATGKYALGDQLPTYADLCRKLGFSLLTVQRAMGDLAREGSASGYIPLYRGPPPPSGTCQRMFS